MTLNPQQLPKHCPTCNTDWTRPNCVRQMGYVGATWGGTVVDGQWVNDDSGAEMCWDSEIADGLMCQHCQTIFPIVDPSEVEAVVATVLRNVLKQPECEGGACPDPCLRCDKCKCDNPLADVCASCAL